MPSSNYGNEEDFIEYVESRGNEIPNSADDETLQAALLVASEWLDGIYGPSFSGSKTNGFTQAREWPRLNAITNTFPQYVFADDEIPDRIVKATYEAAFRQVNDPGSLLVDYKPNKYKSVSIDGVLSVDYANITQSSDIQAQFSAIDQILAPLFDSCASSSFSNLSGGTSRT